MPQRRILIVGGGQSALMLAHGLIEAGEHVTLLTAQDADEIETGWPSVMQFATRPALMAEAGLGLPVWADTAPPIRRLHMRVGVGEHETGFTGAFSAPAVSIDRRLKMADWLERLRDRCEQTRRGGVVVHGATVSDLDYFTRMYDLVIVAVGGGELGALFDTDPDRSGGAHPRTIVQAYVDGESMPLDDDDQLQVVSRPGRGEVFLAPVLTHQGAGYGVMALADPEGDLDPVVPDSGRDAHRHRFSSQKAWDALISTASALAPHIADRLADAAPIEGRAVMGHRVHPVVRSPVGRLPSGGIVLGLADSVMTTGPLSGQGWRISAMAAQVYLAHIRAHDGAFDEAFMHRVFEDFWDQHGSHSARFSEVSHGHFPTHFPALLTAAAHSPTIADRWAAGIEDPSTLTDWMFDADAAAALIARHSAHT